jgi:hypothetical protein
MKFRLLSLVTPHALGMTNTNIDSLYCFMQQYGAKLMTTAPLTLNDISVA